MSIPVSSLSLSLLFSLESVPLGEKEPRKGAREKGGVGMEERSKERVSLLGKGCILKGEREEVGR